MDNEIKSPDEKKLEKLTALFELVNQDFATPEDLINFTEAILGIIATEKERLDSLIAEKEGKASEEVASTLAELTKRETNLLKLIDTLRSDAEESLSQATQALQSDIKRVEKKIPTKTDLTGLEAEIKAIKESFNTLPTELTINNEAIRDGLELLNGDERLDRSAIKGLDDYEEIARLAREPKTIGNAGVKLLRYLSDVNLAGITNGQTIVWNDTLHRFEPGSAGSGGGHIIEDEGTPLTQRDTLNFVGAGVTVTDSGSKTVVTISGGGSGAVDSVNGETGVVVLTTDDISDTAQTNKWATAAEKTKLGHISVTQAVDLDAIESASHAALTVTDSAEIDFTLTGQDLTASLKTGSIDETKLDASVNASLTLANSASQPGHTHTASNVTDFTEAAQDATGAMVDTTLVYTDATPLLSRAALTGAITASAGSNTTALGSFTKSQLSTAVSDGDVLFVGDVTSNATHTGEVTGSGALTVDKTAISNRTDTVITASDYILFGDASDTDNLKKDTVQGILDLVSGGTNTYFNDIYIDQAGGTSDTYGALTGTRNGSNTVFTVSQGSYATGTLQVWRNGQLLTQGSSEDWTETTPGSGTFTFVVAPASTDEITVAYQKVVTNSSTVVTTSTVDELAQDAVGTILVDSAEIDFTYSDATPSITASIVAGSIDETKLDASTNASLDLADTSLQPGAIGSTVQGYDADLAAIAALTPSNDDFIQRKAGAWTNRTVAQVKTDLGVIGSGLQLPTYVVAASGGDYTDIQSALDAAAANYPSGCTIFLADDSYTVTSTLQFKSSGVEIVGNGSGTIINCNGATVTTLFSSNADTYQRNALRNLYLNQTNATVQGVAIRAANMSLCIYDNIRILSFGTAINLDGSAANTFYNTFKDIKIFECNNGISIAGTNPVNDNMFQNIRISLRAGGAGTGVAISRGQSNNFYNLNVEPSAGTGITGLSITTANAFDNLFMGIYAEANATNVSIGSGVLRTTFIGGQIIGALTTNLSDSGTETSFFNTDVGSSVKNSWSPFTAIDTTSAGKIAGYFSNNTTFAHTGSRLVQAQLLNATDTSIVLELNNAGSGNYITADSNFTVSKAGIVSSSGGFRPITNDTGALGSATLSFSDLFLASGAVINFNNGDATITHSAGLLTSNVDVVVPDEAYGVSWNGSLEVPTKNAVYDKIETISGGGSSLGLIVATAGGFNMV